MVTMIQEYSFAKYPAIFPLMTSGIAMQLLRKESDILVEVLEALKETRGRWH